MRARTSFSQSIWFVAILAPIQFFKFCSAHSEWSYIRDRIEAKLQINVEYVKCAKKTITANVHQFASQYKRLLLSTPRVFILRLKYILCAHYHCDYCTTELN